VSERNTRQREAIREAFSQAQRPLSPQEAHGLAQAAVPQLGIATVYRCISRLTADGELVAVELPGLPPRYELAGLAHHHHFHCEECGRVYDLPGCPGNIERLIPKGFRLERHELVLYGQCPACCA
jgi:Fur family ferric uptake transcriptional regulator